MKKVSRAAVTHPDKAAVPTTSKMLVAGHKRHPRSGSAEFHKPNPHPAQLRLERQYMRHSAKDRRAFASQPSSASHLPKFKPTASENEPYVPHAKTRHARA